MKQLETYTNAGLGARLGFGKQPAVLVVDLQLGFTRPDLSPLAGNLDGVIDNVNTILVAARRKNALIAFTVIGYAESAPRELGLWLEKVPSLGVLKLESTLTTLDARLLRDPSDIVIVKRTASAFSGTMLASYLAAARVDTVIVTGCTTSGCVRASATDAIFSGFRPIIPIEAVGDRAEDPHEANLFDIAMKYADVVPIGDVLTYLRCLEVPA